MIKCIVILLFFINCKERNEKKQQSEKLIEQEVKNQREVNVKTEDSIKVFHISYDSTEINKTEKITAITKGVQADFLQYQFTKDLNELRDIKEIRKLSKSKGFLKTLARDFKNKDFLEVSSIHYSYVEPRSDKNPSRISVEEWYFEDQQKAKSCFESLKKYEEATILFKTVNWIWVHQQDKIFLVFALNHQVTDKEMQRIKQEIIDVIKPSGKYETVQFYE